MLCGSEGFYLPQWWELPVSSVERGTGVHTDENYGVLCKICRVSGCHVGWGAEVLCITVAMDSTEQITGHPLCG